MTMKVLLLCACLFLGLGVGLMESSGASSISSSSFDNQGMNDLEEFDDLFQSEEGGDLLESDSESDEDINGPFVARPAGCRNSKTNPQICRKDGVAYRYRNRRAVKRGSQWFKSPSSMKVWRRGRWSKARGGHRHPTDPRYKRIGGRWVRRSPQKISKFVKSRRGLWWKSAKRRKFYWWGKWNTPVWYKPRNDPRKYKQTDGKWGVHLHQHPYVLWEGVWLRAAGSKEGYWNKRWRQLRRIIRNNPNFQKSTDGKWRNVALTRPTKYVAKWGWWFRSKGSPLVFRRRKWRLYSTMFRNHPGYQMTRSGRWRRIKTVSMTTFKKIGKFYWRGNQVYYHGAWISKSRWRALRRTERNVSTLSEGGLTTDMKAAIKDQVFTNFSRFMKWFIGNYLRGGSNVRRGRLVPDQAVDDRDKYNPGKTVHKTSTVAEKSLADMTIDGNFRRKAVRKRDPLRATITWAERQGIQRANMIRSDPVSDGRAASAATFLSTSAEEGAENSVDNVGAGGVTGTEAGIATVDPTLPAELNGGERTSVISSHDPSLNE